MPNGMNGFGVLAALKDDPRFRDIPVIVVSGEEDDEIAGKCLAAGAAGYRKKPIAFETLRKLVSDLLT